MIYREDIIQEKLADNFNRYQKIIIPNAISFTGTHEIDLLVITKSQYATEIEIKTSIADLKNDLKKKHKHHSEYIKEFYFCITFEMLEKAKPIIAQHYPHAGLFYIRYHPESESYYRGVLEGKRPAYYTLHCIKPAKQLKAKKLEAKQILALASMSAWRVWNLREKLRKVAS